MVELKFLGTPEVTVAGQPVTAALDRKHVALLAYLAVERAWVAREKAADLLWGEEYTDSKALQNLRQAILEINHLLSGVIEKDRRLAIRLGRTASLHLDIEQFEEARAKGNFERAAALYRGSFLDSLSLKDEETFEEWLRAQREYFERLALESLAAAMRLADGRRDNDALERYARRSLAINPEREDAYRSLMLALGRKGQYNEALRAYSDCAGMLRREFDQSPSAETMAVNERIHLARALPRRDLPFHAATFVGRERELAEAAATLLRPDCRLLTFLGPGGAGKTRLAIELARRNRSLFLHDVCYVALESRGADVSRENILSALAGALGVPISANRLLEDVIDHVRPRELLIVLDNFEPFVPVAAILNDIVRNAPDVKILVTSREMLNIAEEAIYRVGGLAYPPDGEQPPQSLPNRPGEISGDQYDAIAFFGRVAGRLDAGFNPAANGDDVIRICRLVEGLPLALEMIAPWTLTMSCGAIVDRISAGMTNLIEYERNFPERHRSLNAVFEHSWARLTPAEQRVFQRLAVIVGAISPAAAEAIAGGTKPILESLVRKSMIANPEKESYSLHTLLRAFALEKLIAAGELHETRQRHLDYFTHFVASRLPELRGTGQIVALQDLEAEFGNIRAAWRHGMKHASVDKLDILMDGIVRLCNARTWFVTGIEVVREATETLAGRGLSNLHNRLLLHEGLMLFELGDYALARRRAEHLLDEPEEHITERVTAQALYLMAMVHYNQNRYDEAEQLLLRSVNLARRSEEWEVAADCYKRLGTLVTLRTFFSTAGKPPYKPPRPFFYEHYPPTEQRKKAVETATVYLEEAIHLYTRVENLMGVASTRSIVGFSNYVVHKYQAAVTEYRAAVAIFRQMKATNYLGQCLSWLAWVLYLLGEAAAARRFFHEALSEGVALLGNKYLLDCLQKYSLFLWTTEMSHFTPLAINAFVAQHPYTDGRMRVVAQEWVENISDFMREDEGQEAVEKALAFGRSQTLTSLVHSLVPEL